MSVYTIKSGDHYSDHLPKLYLGIKKSFNITVNFDSSCIYNLGNIDQLDVNKLFGVSFGYHEDNSIRIGWVWNLTTQKIDLYAYDYQSSVRRFNLIGSCNVGENVNLTLDLGSMNYSITGSNIILGRQYFQYSYPSFKLGYYLFPYFGGNESAPHIMKINLDFN